MTRTALVTGGNRGIGLEACRQLAGSGLDVVLAARDRQRGEQAARELQDEGLTSPTSRWTLQTDIASRIASDG